MKVKLIRYPYKDYEVGEIVDLGEEKNRSMVSIGRAVWVEEGKKKKKPTKKVTKTTTQTEDNAGKDNNKKSKKTIKKTLGEKSENEDSPPTRGADGRFTSKKKKEEPIKKGFLSKLRQSNK